jgi:hypothetical protein
VPSGFSNLLPYKREGLSTETISHELRKLGLSLSTAEDLCPMSSDEKESDHLLPLSGYWRESKALCIHSSKDERPLSVETWHKRKPLRKEPRPENTVVGYKEEAM